ncbi:MAG: amylo-alpha-1,6-glucosidase, partial [Verrucomicrobiota bacterium]
DGTFQSPGAWGVVWEDLTELEYADRELWRTIADILLFWCGEGVDGFRCDAGYMIPLPVWEYLTAKVRLQYPETLFFLEGLGGKLSTTETLLGPGGMNWAYSELFQTENREAMDRYLPYANNVSEQRGLLLHFAETHDNNRLAANGRTYAKMRTFLAALCAPNGAFGITNGVEWFAQEKVDVHGASCLNWGATPNLIEELRRLNALLACHPCFHPGTKMQLVHRQIGNAIALLRTNGNRSLLVLVNLDAAAKQTVAWRAEAFSPNSNSALDILGDASVNLRTDNDCSHRLLLEPGQALCLTTDADDSARVDRQLKEHLAHCGRVMRQRSHALAAAVHERLNPGQSISEGGVENLARSLMDSPATALRDVAGRHPGTGVVVWRAGTDQTRQVMVPADHFLLVLAAAPFRVRIFQDQAVLCHEHSLFAESAGTHFAVLMPPAPSDVFAECQLQLRCYKQNGVHPADGPILLLPSPERAAVRLSAPRGPTLENDLYAICANQLGAVAHVNGEWGRLDSVYDCLLGANLNPTVPVDRHIMLRRLRAWAVVRGYSTELNADSLQSFGQHPDGSVLWQFRFPAANGLYVTLHAHLRLCELRNRIELRFSRLPAEDERDLPDSAPVRLVLRPDLEDRICHGVTKAFDGPQQTWANAISEADGGFSFQPVPERALHVALPGGGFVSEPEWLYAVPHPVEASRGLEHLSDLFSPGYLHTELHGDEHADFSADNTTDQSAEHRLHVADETAGEPASPSPSLDASTTLRILEQSMDRFVVRRGEHRTVIAGYPWFLDWGRDTLICLRGLIAANRLDESRDILIQFARFEQDGTIPNMIRGDDASNRDTSDAPLWLFTALNDLLEADGNDEFLDADAGGRPIRKVLGAIGKNLLAGTPNGIAVDPKSGLVFSPAHFTWMDTNHPAGTPREGYPIEIQALWHAALDLLVRIGDTNADWGELRNQVRDAIPRLFFRPELGYFADCLHARPGTSATNAQADDHLRPNQLFALTLGAVDDRLLAHAALNACEELLVPGAIRSLANRAVQHQLPIQGPAGLLNEPTHPYWGRYEGDEDTRRKPAYHNGTAWTWPYPSYCEALAKWQGETARFTARSLLTAGVHLLNQGCIAQLPEIIDGDAPHTFRGCGAQAWSVTELYRVMKLLSQ